MKKTGLRVPLLMALLLPAVANAQPANDPRPSVQVRVVIAEPDVRADFDDETELLEALVAEKMAEFLNLEVRFLRFSTHVELPPDVVLTLTLGITDAPQLLHPLDLFAQISGTAVADGSTPFRIQVRDLMTASGPRGTVETFAAEIVAAAHNIDHQTWVQELFSLVILGAQAHAFQDPSGWYWALPFRLDEVGAETRTEFLVDSELTVHGNVQERRILATARGHIGADNQSIPETFRTKAMAEITRFVDSDDDDHDVDLMSQASKCRSRRILLSTYVRAFSRSVDESSGADLDLSDGPDGGTP